MLSDIPDSEDEDSSSSYASRVTLPEVALPLRDGLCVELLLSVGKESDEEPLFGIFLLPRKEDLLGGIGALEATELELGLLIASP